MDKEIIEFLKKCKLQLDDETQLEGQLIPRDILLSQNTYEEVKAEIDVLKKKFSSSALTSLQSGAQKEQKWPLLNLVRQILRVCNYKMEPVRRSDGYDDEGKKKYKRFFLVKKFKAVQAQTV
jgi:hypothetical protein|tara:strand:- start:1931 stop:2296 length:366 start_codon:yes stop_codon:yes gene_type:complete